MKITLTQEIKIGGRTVRAGETVEADEGTTAQLLSHGYARPAAEPVETAAAPAAPETAARLPVKARIQKSTT
jgi:hypothetical protein